MKKIISILIAFILCFSTCIPAFAAENSICSVTYGNASQFIFNPNDGDLFENFKGVMPGDVLSQKIILSNKLSSKDITLYMRAEVDEKYKDFLDYITIRVELFNNDNKDGKVLAENKASVPGTLEDNTSLGTYSPNESGYLMVTISVDKSMGNEFKKASGIIDWIFSAEEGKEVIVTPPDIPHTGTDGNWFPFVLLGASVLAIVITVLTKKKSKPQEEETKE